MRYVLGLMFLLLDISNLSAQEKHFIFIQADNNMPFYVQVNGKMYSSTATGYVIIPKLLKGQYNLTVGFAQNTVPEQSFQTTIENKDLGYNLKNFGEKGWGLFDLQTFDVTMGTPAGSSAIAHTKPEPVQEEEPVISFDKTPMVTPPVVTETAPVPATTTSESVVKLLLQIPAILKIVILDKTTVKGVDGKTVVQPQPPIADNAQRLPVTIPAIVKTEVVDGTSIKAAPSATVPAIQTAPTEVMPGVTKVGETKTADSLTMAFVDKKGSDTIQVVIPATTDAPATTPAVRDTIVNIPTETPAVKTDKAPLQMLTLPAACKSLASEEDYYKLRKKMLNQMSDDKMIAEARKAFQAKCFSTSQVKALSVLFMSDEGRYKFFDASYSYVHDPERFSSLQSEFIDSYYLNRFKAMLR